MRTFAEFKRSLNPGQKIILTYHHWQDTSDDIKSRIGIERYIIKVMSNQIVIGLTPEDKWGSHLEFPPASLMEITDTGFAVYLPGVRELSAEEKRIKDNEPRDARQEEIDIMTDGSQMFWRRKRYYSENNAEYLQGFKFVQGKRFDHNTGKMEDKGIKGKKELEYTIIQ